MFRMFHATLLVVYCCMFQFMIESHSRVSLVSIIMDCCDVVRKLLLTILVSFGAVLLYLHAECLREVEEKHRNRFNEVYNPDDTDCVAELPFIKHGIEFIEFSLGRHCEGIL